MPMTVKTGATMAPISAAVDRPLVALEVLDTVLVPEEVLQINNHQLQLSTSMLLKERFATVSAPASGVV